MSHRIKQNIDFLKVFPTLSKQMRNKLLNNIDNGLVNCICEICLNLIKCNIPMEKSHKRRLAHFKHIIRALATKNRTTSLKKKKYIIQRGGSFLPLLFSLLTPLVAQIIK